MRRKSVNKRKGAKRFNKGASKTHKMNLKVMRGVAALMACHHPIPACIQEDPKQDPITGTWSTCRVITLHPLSGTPTSSCHAAHAWDASKTGPPPGRDELNTRQPGGPTTRSSHSPTTTRSCRVMDFTRNTCRPSSSASVRGTVVAIAVFAALMSPACVIWRAVSTEQTEEDPTITCSPSTADSLTCVESAKTYGNPNSSTRSGPTANTALASSQGHPRTTSRNTPSRKSGAPLPAMQTAWYSRNPSYGRVFDPPWEPTGSNNSAGTSSTATSSPRAARVPSQKLQAETATARPRAARKPGQRQPALPDSQTAPAQLRTRPSGLLRRPKMQSKSGAFAQTETAKPNARGRNTRAQNSS